MDFPALTRTGAMEFFSEFGKTIYNPQGILYWTRKAKAKARINATIGSARGPESTVYPDGGEREITLCAPLIHSFFNGLETEEIFPYTPETGTPAFRSAWRKWILSRAGGEAERLERQLHQPILTPGITAAISIAARMFVDPGRSIITADRRWENYDHVLGKNLGIRIADFPLFADGDLNVGGLVSVIQRVWLEQDNAVVLLNFPNNPTGFCPSAAAGRRLVESLEQLAEGTGKRLVVMFDDAYESYVYDPAAVQSSLFYLLRPRPNLLPVKLDGLTKELLWYGARAGTITLACPDEWLSGDDAGIVATELDNKFGGVNRGLFSNNSTVTQSVATRAMEQMERLMVERRRTFELLKQRYRTLKDELGKMDTDLVTVEPFQGGFFCFVTLRPESGLRATDVANHLLDEHGVGTVPFDGDTMNGLRIAFCSVESADLPELCRRLAQTVNVLAETRRQAHGQA